MTKEINAVEFAQDLIRCKSITPADDGALDTLERVLSDMGFVCTRLPFQEEGTPRIDNLYARRGTASPNLCFAGHTDVVPTGDESNWSDDPFAATIRDGVLYGRGATDMKGAVAAFVAAVSRVEGENGSISLLITGDEEGPAVNGTRKMLVALDEMGEKLDMCIVGEPTNPNALGEMIKIGRRGSMNMRLDVIGTQGHAAYPHLADNPVPRLHKLLGALRVGHWDEGTDRFLPSNLEVTALSTDAQAFNVIPGRATAMFNIRFSDLHTGASIAEEIRAQFDSVGVDYELDVAIKGEAFLCEPGALAHALQDASKAQLGKAPEFSTTGGTSDARYIKDYAEVAEFGLVSQSMHKIDENANVADIETLANIYEDVIRRLLK